MSDKEKKYISSNIKFLRKEAGLTQEELAQELGIIRHSIGSYEEGRAEPKNDTILAMLKFFNIPFEVFIERDLNQMSKSELEQIREGYKRDIEGKNIRVLATTVSPDDKEYIQLVQQKAAAGYLNGYADAEFIENLPKFNLPIPELDTKYGTFRAFQVSGDSMLPIKPGSYVIGQYLQDWNDIKDDEIYVVVSLTEGVVLKRVKNRIARDGKSGTLLLKSDNQAYQAYEINIEDIQEVWKARAYISLEFPEPDMTLDKLTYLVLDLQQEVIKMKNH